MDPYYYPFTEQYDSSQNCFAIHAPIPTTGQSPPLIYADFDESAVVPVHAQAQDQGILVTPELQPPATFPTPSELLADISNSGDGLPTSSTPPEYTPADLRSETARRARRRAMAESVGFVPTDPDTISSHDKKRHYLECIEHYIQYLHQQFELVGETPLPMERVSTYRGLTNRSIRTLLVHMEHSTRRLNEQTLTEEEKFVAMRDEALRRQGH